MKNNSYDDIINLPHPVSKNHPQMPLRDRAAQFAPFAALTGHDAAIKETARLTDERLELSEEVLAQLNEKINIIKNNIGIEQNVSITYFIPDAKKAGGSYVVCSGVVKKVDEYEHTIIMTDQTVIPIEQISGIKCEGMEGLETRQRLVSILADNIKEFMEGNPVNVVSSL